MAHDKGDSGPAGPPPGAAAALPWRLQAVCDAVGEFVAYWGFKAIHGRVWALLAMHRGSVSQAHIARQLGVSRALVSGAIAELVGYGLVRPVGAARQAPYEAVMDVWPTISDVLRGREWMLVERARLALQAALDEVGGARRTGEPTPYSAERLRFLLQMTELAQALLRALIALRAPRALAGLRGWSRRAAAFVQSFAPPAAGAPRR